MLDSPLGRRRVMSLLLHEMGHALAVSPGEDDRIFGRLTRCLRPRVNAGEFSSNSDTQDTLNGESVADWLSAQALGEYMADLDDRSARADLLAQSMGGTMCDSLGAYERGGQRACLFNDDGTVRYPAQISATLAFTTDSSGPGVNTPSGPVSCMHPDNWDHPLGQDRYAIYLRSSIIRDQLQCVGAAEPEEGMPDGEVRECHP